MNLKLRLSIYIIVGLTLMFVLPISLPYVFAYFIPEARLDILILISVLLAILFAVVGFIFLKHAKVLSDLMKAKTGAVFYRLFLLSGIGLMIAGAFLPISPTHKAGMILVGIFLIVVDFASAGETEITETKKEGET